MAPQIPNFKLTIPCNRPLPQAVQSNVVYLPTGGIVVSSSLASRQINANRWAPYRQSGMTTFELDRPHHSGSVCRLATMVCFLALTGIFSSACSTEGSEITAYPMLCGKPLQNGKCSEGAIPLNRTTYLVFPASQRVVYWAPGINEVPVLLEQCAVRDSRNWKCRFPRNEGEAGFADGEFKEGLIPRRLEQDKFYYVGGPEWWWHHLVASRI